MRRENRLVGPIYLNKGRRTFYMQCGFHAYMESWAMAVNNPYYAVTDVRERSRSIMFRRGPITWSFGIRSQDPG